MTGPGPIGQLQSEPWSKSISVQSLMIPKHSRYLSEQIEFVLEFFGAGVLTEIHFGRSTPLCGRIIKVNQYSNHMVVIHTPSCTKLICTGMLIDRDNHLHTKGEVSTLGL
ncbi:hypothetical protein L2E82_31595 [Cichorium intybus]|uniref:Uncharacterized protein n=1 Tax=Cichorium intybus TaxID=13427 RepID=A0ACB9BED1_CICIN|nr:hypothetical protein L2E82_31595 [Cichorium intybus]